MKGFSFFCLCQVCDDGHPFKGVGIYSFKFCIEKKMYGTVIFHLKSSTFVVFAKLKMMAIHSKMCWCLVV